MVCAQEHTMKTGLNHAVRVTVAALSILLGLGAAVPAAAQCPGDIVATGGIDGTDLAAVLGAWGTNGQGTLVTDLDGDGIVNGADLAVILSGWGPCAPVITSVLPNVGTITGGTPITISGNYFFGTTSVTVGEVAATGLEIVNATTINATTPAGAAGSAAVSVTANGRTGTLAGGFSYSNSSISSVVPSTGSAQGGGTVMITGAFLQNTTAVWFGDVSAQSFTQISPTVVSAVTPPGAVGTSVDVRLQTPAGLLVATGAFSYVGIVVPPWATLLDAAPDPAVVTDPTLRNAISATGLAWRVRDMATQMEMLLVPPGTFQRGCIMGSNQYGCSSIELPVHQVTLTNAFYLGRYEVTQAQWQASMGSNPSHYQSASVEVPQAQVPQRPVERVSWNTVQGYLVATGMRLPTEAEWEYACRAGTQTPFYNGSTEDSSVGDLAWYVLNSGGQTHPVGGKAANALGFHDMLGNVGEWVRDVSSFYPTDAQTDPTGPANGSERRIRGGAAIDIAGTNYVRSSSRLSRPTGNSYFYVGFRVARTP